MWPDLKRSEELKMRELYLYHTQGCHLCELAQEQIEPLLTEYQLLLKEVDIANDTELLERYGIRIPVIRLASSCDELSWPFDTRKVRHFLDLVTAPRQYKTS
jgi:hypothetical protein